MPWAPELFSAPVLERVLAERREGEPDSVPYFSGLMSGELHALIESFAGQPEVYDPIRGRVRGVQGFTAFYEEMTAMLTRRHATVEEVERVILSDRGLEEVILHLDGERGPVSLPVAVVADHSGSRLDELRIYFSGWPLTGQHRIRQPLLQSDPRLSLPDVVGQYQRALATGDVEAIVSTFEPDGYVREPSGDEYVHDNPGDVRVFYDRLCSNGGGIPLEHCALLDDKHTRALEYNVTHWGATELPPQAGLAVYVRGQTGKMSAVRIYDDVAYPISTRS